jgi:hypothetical protein
MCRCRSHRQRLLPVHPVLRHVIVNTGPLAQAYTPRNPQRFSPCGESGSDNQRLSSPCADELEATEPFIRHLEVGHDLSINR